MRGLVMLAVVWALLCNVGVFGRAAASQIGAGTLGGGVVSMAIASSVGAFGDGPVTRGYAGVAKAGRFGW